MMETFHLDFHINLGVKPLTCDCSMWKQSQTEQKKQSRSFPACISPLFFISVSATDKDNLNLCQVPF